MKTRMDKLGQVLGGATRWMLGVTCLVVTGTIAYAQDDSRTVEQADPPRPEREAQFKEMLDGATLVGHFTVTGRDAFNPKEERYHLQSVEKLPNGLWLFRSRIRYGDHDVTVPLPLPVEWAGDTPMIVVNKVPVPGLGTFSARVLFFDGHYAGYWSGGDHGGHLFGVIERNGEDPPAVDEETK